MNMNINNSRGWDCGWAIVRIDPDGACRIYPKPKEADASKTVINSVTPEGRSSAYVVGKYIDGSWWFWGGYDSQAQATAAAERIRNSRVFMQADIEAC